MNAEPRRIAYFVEGLAVFACFLAYSLVQALIPGINEPHYLCKAKHLWDPSYCPGDFFLDSSNPHFFFYVTIGAMTPFLSLEQTALVGRCLALGILAVGWTLLFRKLIPIAGGALLLAGMFLGYTAWQIELCNWNGFSGEWIVGGVESKVFAWGLLFWSLAAIIEKQSLRCAALLGLAISFHPVIGVWGGFGIAVAVWAGKGEPQGTFAIRRVPPLLALVVTALPGLIPALATILERHPDAAEANRIQVIERLGHHLDPLRFPGEVYLLYAVLIAIWLGGAFARRSWSFDAATTNAHRAWFGFVLTSVVVALGGIVLGLLRLAHLPPTVANLVVTLMKFYPFRLADILIPLAALVSLADLATARFVLRPWLTPLLVILGFAGLAAGLQPELGSRNPEKFAAGQEAAWIDICRWIDAHTPPDAVVLALRSELTFKWYASRANFVSHKDMPQDAAGIMEWQRCRELLDNWYDRNYEDEFYSQAELAELRELTGASYLIARRLGPLEIEPVYRNKVYRVYELPGPR